MHGTNSIQVFKTGLVFGFDVGTGSLGYAVRKGAKFLDVGVIICDSEGSDLSNRRNLRRQRRTLRSRKFRRQWFANELEKLDIPKPTQSFHDPITLRLRAIKGEEIVPEELHVALLHLFKRRGYSKVPWANIESAAKDATKPKKEDDEGKIKEEVKKNKEKLSGKHPCQFLAEERAKAGKSPTTNWARKIHWPREVLRDEFLAIVEAQKSRFPKLAEKADWLLYGDSQIKTKGEDAYHVFFKTTEARNPGVLGLRWPRFDNRSPALDSLQPVDQLGRPLHVARKTKEAFIKAQWPLALINFRVIDLATGKLTAPDDKSLIRLREIWENSKRKKKTSYSDAKHEPESLKISEKVMERWAKDFAHQYKLVEGQQPLTPQTGAGRARYSSLTLNRISAGEHFDPPQPTLRRQGENAEQALNRYLADIKHPLVRHRLILFRRLLSQLVLRFGEPDMIVLEAVRSLAMGEKKKREYIQRIKENRDERENIRTELKKDNFSSSKNSILRYRLFKEAKGRCPFCLCPFCLQEVVFNEAEIEHIVPRSRVDCNEFYNLTVAHERCNKEKNNRTPWEAFGGTSNWESLRKNAEDCFGPGSLKYRLFINPDAQNLVEEKSDLQHTAYIARVIRHISLIHLGWLNDEGRDPTPEKQNAALAFQVTNGQLTSRLRKAWGLNQILHPLPPGKRWNELTDDEQKQFTEKNRGDLRHHALDAMVIACTLPWLAHRTHGATDEFGQHGWWTQDEKQRSKAANPIFSCDGQMHDIVKTEIQKVVVRHHVSQSNHQQAYATTLYAKKDKDTYVAREIFSTLTPKNLADIWPREFAAYCQAAWSCYVEESPNIETELKQNRGCVPESFTNKLCFSHYQHWCANNTPPFAWPKKIKIPIRSVRLISVKDDTAVVPFSLGTHAYVKRTRFKEVRIHMAEDGKRFVPVFIPYWKEDKPLCEEPIRTNRRPLAVIRRGMVIETKNPFSTGQPPGKYRVLTTGQKQLRLLPHHVANKVEAILSFGLGKKGLQPYWPDFIRALGYELPHPPSAQSQSAGPAEA